MYLNRFAQKWNSRHATVSEVKRLQIHSGYYMCNGNSPMDTGVRLGVTVMQRPCPLDKANGFILVWEFLTGIISVRLLRSHGSRAFTLN